MEKIAFFHSYNDRIEEDQYLNKNEKGLLKVLLHEYLNYLYSHRVGYNDSMMQTATNMAYGSIYGSCKEIYHILAMINILTIDLNYDVISCVADKKFKSNHHTIYTQLIYDHSNGGITIKYHNELLEESTTLLRLQCLAELHDTIQFNDRHDLYLSLLTDGYHWERTYASNTDKNQYKDIITYKDIKIEVMINDHEIHIVTIYHPEEIVSIDYQIQSDLLEFYSVLSTLFATESEEDIEEFFEYTSKILLESNS